MRNNKITQKTLYYNLLSYPRRSGGCCVLEFISLVLTNIIKLYHQFIQYHKWILEFLIFYFKGKINLISQYKEIVEKTLKKVGYFAYFLPEYDKNADFNFLS